MRATRLRYLLPRFFLILALAGGVRAGDATAILILGDSLSAAYRIPTARSWPALLQRRLNGRELPFLVVNASRKGETTAGGLQRLPPLLDAYHPRIVVIELGANDALRAHPLDAIETDLRSLLEAVRRNGATPLLVGVQLPPRVPATYARDFAALFERAAGERATPFVPSLLARIVGHPEYFLSDQLHPNAEAQTALLETVWPALAPALGMTGRDE